MASESEARSKLRLALSSALADERQAKRFYQEAINASNASPGLSPEIAATRQRLDTALKAAVKRVESAKRALAAHDKSVRERQKKEQESKQKAKGQKVRRSLADMKAVAKKKKARTQRGFLRRGDREDERER